MLFVEFVSLVVEVLSIFEESMLEDVVGSIHLVLFQRAQEQVVGVVGLLAHNPANTCQLLGQLHKRLKKQCLVGPMGADTIDQPLQLNPGHNMRSIDNSKWEIGQIVNRMFVLYNIDGDPLGIFSEHLDIEGVVESIQMGGMDMDLDGVDWFDFEHLLHFTQL